MDWRGEGGAPSIPSRSKELCKGWEELKEDTWTWSIVRPRVVKMMMESDDGYHGREFSGATGSL